MSLITGYALMMQTAVKGIGREFDRGARAADQISQGAAEFSAIDKVAVSPEAVAAARAGDSTGISGMEKPLVDMRVAKYSAIADMRVLETADQLAQDLNGIVK